MPRSFRRSHGRHRSTTLRAATVAAVLAVSLAACGDDTPDTTGDPAGACLEGSTECDDVGAPVESDGAAGDSALTAFVDVVPALPEGTRAVETAPSDAPFPLMIRMAAADGSSLHLLVGAGEAPCMWLVGAEVVSETAEEVVVTVTAGGDPEADGCDQQVISDQSLTVALSEPLGERALLDASRITTGGPAS